MYVNGNPFTDIDPLGLWAWGDPVDQSIVDFSAGFGDVVSFGITDLIRDVMNTNSAVNKCSVAYSAGQVGGIGVSTAIGYGGGIRAAGRKGTGIEFSHWIPNRMGGPRSIYNGNFVTPARHYYHDPFRYPRGWRDLGSKWPRAIQQFDRIPNVYKGTATGAAYGIAGKSKSDCECP